MLVQDRRPVTRSGSASPSSSAWRSRRRCWAFTASTGGSGSRCATCAATSRTCRTSPATTSGCAALPLVKQVIRDLAADSDFWFDNVWIADSTPVECGRSRPTVKRSDLAGWAGYGYCASHSRWFWGLRLYLICPPAGLPVLWSLADPKIGEREVLAAMLDVEPHLATARPGLILITGQGFAR